MPRNPDEIGAMWEKTSGRGPYMTGTINGERVVMFKQTDKTNDKAPDWRVLKAKPREAVSQPDGHADEPVAPITDSDIPFAWLLPFLLPVLVSGPF